MADPTPKLDDLRDILDSREANYFRPGLPRINPLPRLSEGVANATLEAPATPPAVRDPRPDAILARLSEPMAGVPRPSIRIDRPVEIPGDFRVRIGDERFRVRPSVEDITEIPPEIDVEERYWSVQVDDPSRRDWAGGALIEREGVELARTAESLNARMREVRLIPSVQSIPDGPARLGRQIDVQLSGFGERAETKRVRNEGQKVIRRRAHTLEIRSREADGEERPFLGVAAGRPVIFDPDSPWVDRGVATDASVDLLAPTVGRLSLFVADGATPGLLARIRLPESLVGGFAVTPTRLLDPSGPPSPAVPLAVAIAGEQTFEIHALEAPPPGRLVVQFLITPLRHGAFTRDQLLEVRRIVNQSHAMAAVARP